MTDAVELVARAIIDEHDPGAFDRLLKTSILPNETQATAKLRKLRRQAQFAITTLKADGWVKVPEGWQCVPKEPTPAQHEAGGEAARWFNKMLNRNNEIPLRSMWDTAYRAMLSAAPSLIAERGDAEIYSG